jgi:radical SAM superfamily enzyme YgiQ (UPF0313 family)
MTRKLLLINPVEKADINISNVPVLRLPPLCLAYIASLTPSDWDIKIIDENIEPFTFEYADLVGLTAMTSNAHRAYEITALYREKGVKTVMGGIHASILYDEAIRFVDSVVVGEAESVWRGLIHDFEGNRLKRFYKGEHTSLEKLTRAGRHLYSDKYKIKNTVQTARGCPMDCEFCSVTIFNGGKYRQRPIEDVLNELESINSRLIYFVDDNILGYGEKAEKRAIQLFRGMKERGLHKRWASQVGIDFANNPDVLKYAQKAGCAAVFIGFESLNEEALQDMHKIRNLKARVSNYKEIVKRIHDYGIGVIGAFTFGSDGDKNDIFSRTIEFLLDSKMDAQQLTILTPLPGTRLYRRLAQEGRLLRTDYPEDWKYYDFTEAVFKPRHMTPDELKEGVAEIYRHTTLRAKSLRRALNSLLSTRNVYATIISYVFNRGYGSICTRKYEKWKKSISSNLLSEKSSEKESEGVLV